MKRIIFFLFVFLPIAGYAQYIQFNKDSIPTIEGKVVFKVHFKLGLSKEEFHKRTDSYLNNRLRPYSAKFIVDNDNYTICRVTDYIDVVKSFLQVFGMYMTYRLDFKYKDSMCTMAIHNISYMEKGYFESIKDGQSKRAIPRYTAKDIMINHAYSLLLIRKASERITDASLKRINEIIRGLDSSFAKRQPGNRDN